MTRIATIGYEGRAQHDVLGLLVDAGVERLVDVRIRAQSRKPGFSKSTLAAGLADAGIEYQHLRALGTPLEIRAEFRAGNTAEAREEYRAYLRSDPAAGAELELLASIAEREYVALLCFEHDPRACHRLVVVEELAARDSALQVEHLGAPRRV